jgi:hypothetical protein
MRQAYSKQNLNEVNAGKKLSPWEPQVVRHKMIHQVGPTGIEPVPTASETIVLSIGLRAHVVSCCGGHRSATDLDLASMGFADFV